MNTRNFNLWNFIKYIFQKVIHDDITALSAQVTYYFILSFFPSLIFIITVLSYTPLVHGFTLQQLQAYIPDTVYYVILQITDDIFSGRNGTILSFSFLFTFYTASHGIRAIIKGLNRSYNKEETRPRLFITFISTLYAIGVTIAVIIILILLIFGNWIGTLLVSHLAFFPLSHTLWQYIRYLLPIFFIPLVFASLYKALPNLHLKVRQVFPGAVISTIAWMVISQLFQFYVNNFGNYSYTYGSLGGIIILLLWIYVSCTIVIIGGEINAALDYFKSKDAQ